RVGLVTPGSTATAKGPKSTASGFQRPLGTSERDETSPWKLAIFRPSRRGGHIRRRGGAHGGSFVLRTGSIPAGAECGSRVREIRPADVCQSLDARLVGPTLAAHVGEPRGLRQAGARVALGLRREECEAGGADEPRRVTLAEPLE